MPQIIKKSIKMMPKSIKNQLKNQSKNESGFEAQNGTKMAPEIEPGPPKTLPKNHPIFDCFLKGI